MEPIYQQNFTVDSLDADCYGHLKPAALLRYLQEVAGAHFSLLEDPNATITQKGLCWAVSRHRAVIHLRHRRPDRQ